MKRILGLDLGTNSIGWSLVETDLKSNKGKILGGGTRIIPMSKELIGKFDSGQSISQTSKRTFYRGTRRLFQRSKLRRERLHRILNILEFLPEHYSSKIDFKRGKGQFFKNEEVKLNYKRKEIDGVINYEFIFDDSFSEMMLDFKDKDCLVSKDWTIYYLRNKALTQKISKKELAWIILNFNKKRGYYQLRGENLDNKNNKEFIELIVDKIIPTEIKIKGNDAFKILFDNGWEYDKLIVDKHNWENRKKEFIVTSKILKDGTIKRSYKTVDSELDWPAIKAKTENDIIASGKTIGQYIYSNLIKNPTLKIKGGLIKTIERKYYKDELLKILSEQQKYHEELIDKEKFIACINELYPNNEQHKKSLSDKDFTHLFIEDVIFYQRPLKSKKSSIGNCNFEFKIYESKDQNNESIERVKVPLKAISKSHPLFQEFRLWQFVRNIKIYDNTVFENGEEKEVTYKVFESENDFVKLFDFLNSRKHVEQKNIIDYFIKQEKLSKEERGNFTWNYQENKKYPCNETRAQLLLLLKKVVGKKAPKTLISKIEYNLWHIVYSVKDKVQFEKALRKFAKKHQIDETLFVDTFKNIPPYSSDYSSLSYKAINKLLPLMRMGHYWNSDKIDNHTKQRIEFLINGEYDEKISKRVRDKSINLNNINDFKGLPLWLASYIVYDRHSELSEAVRWKSPSDIQEYLNKFKQHSLRNPIVEQVVLETLRVVKDIWLSYGNGSASFFNEIHVELGREMKNPAKKRVEISKRINENQKTNQRAKEILNELLNDSEVQGNIRSYSPSHQELLKLYEEGVYQNPEVNFDLVSEDEINKIRNSNSPSRKDISKYKLWLKQGYTSPYSGKIIPLSKLFTTEYEIEHIIPQSRYFDNSLSNKVICETDINKDKGNKTAMEYLLQKGGGQVDGHDLLNVEEYEMHCKKYFKQNKSKLRNLLSEEIPDSFTNRQLNDTRYISKLINNLLSNIVRDEGEREVTSKKLIPVNGKITSKLKHDWGLNDKWNEIIVPRFKRLNQKLQTTDFGFWDNDINAFRTQVPDSVASGFSKKRIDHRHHALDAIVVALTNRKHIQYLSSLNSNEAFNLKPDLFEKNERKQYSKYFKAPWDGFQRDVKKHLDSIIVSFKSNQRVINKTNNKTWQWKTINGVKKKVLVRQVKGDNWAIRKSLHKETVSGKINKNVPKGKIATASRVSLDQIKNQKHIDKISNINIQKILKNHLNNYIDKDGANNFTEAFSPEGIEDMNKNIVSLNNGKFHHPIKKVRSYEIGKKFRVGSSGNNSSKYVETAKGTNLFFAVYWSDKKQKRNFESLPLHEVIEFQKQVSYLPHKKKLPIPTKPELGQFLFYLSPHDLVFVPNEREIEGHETVNLNKLTHEQKSRIYKMISCSEKECHFNPYYLASQIIKNESGTNNKTERVLLFGHEFDLVDEKNKGVMIKEKCWKLNVDRLGRIIEIDKGTYCSDDQYLDSTVTSDRISIGDYNTVKEDEIQYYKKTDLRQRLKDSVELIKRMFGDKEVSSTNRIIIKKIDL